MQKKSPLKIELIQPQPYEIVDVNFAIYGKVPKSWVYGRFGPSVDLMYEDGHSFMTANTFIVPSIFDFFSKKLKFKLTFNDLRFLEEPKNPLYGLILEVSCIQKDSLLVPLLLCSGFKSDDLEGQKAKVKEKLQHSLEKIIKNRADWKDYLNEVHKLYQSKINDKTILEGIFNILDESDSNFKSLIITEFEIAEKLLKEKYKDAIKEHGPLLGGVVGRMNGFEFCVYSGDHLPQHFHVTHKGKGISARFSFPNIELMKYIGKSNIIGSKEHRKIIDYFNDQEHFKILEEAFKKQILQ